MSNLKPGTEEYKRAVNQIADLNLTIDIFLEKFESFYKSYNITDNNLNNSLKNVINVIENFVDSEPLNIRSDEKTKINFNLKDQSISSVYICEACNEEIGCKYKNIQRHITFSEHITNKSKKVVTSRTANNSILPAAQSVKLNSVKLNNNVEQQHQQQQQQEQPGRKKERLTRKERRALEKRGPDVENLPKKAKKFISRDFSKFLNDAATYGNKLKCLPIYDKIAESLLETIRPIYPNVKYHFFGSRISGLGTIHSDLDMFINIENVFKLYNEPSSRIVSKLNKVHELLLKCPNEWRTFRKISTARVPVLKAINKTYNIDCDIAFSNGLGPCNTKLMRYFFELQPICHKLALFIKEWLLLTMLKTNFTTYTLGLMVVFFLQTKSILPPIYNLQKDVDDDERLMIGPWQGNFIEKQLHELKIKLHDDSYETVRAMLYSFFEYYQKFDFATYVVCPYLGKPMEKESFNTFANPMTRYFNYFKLNKDYNSLQIDKIMCVQDPFEQNHNVTKSITEGLLKRFRYFLELTARELQQ